jgi:hypothetical protein
MRFVPVLLEFITSSVVLSGPGRVRHYRLIRGFIAGANSAIRQRDSVTLPPYFARREPDEEAIVRVDLKGASGENKKE